MSNYKNANPFYEDDDDFSFGNVGRSSGTSSGRGYGASRNDEFGDDPVLSRRAQLQQEMAESKERQMVSQQRALASLNESERMGVATAEELVRQGEQLDNVERKTADINASMKTSQKHINNIKSIFGGFKNWFGGSKPEQEKEIPKRESGLKAFVENSDIDRSAAPHPVEAMRERDAYRSSDRYRDEMDAQKMRKPGDRYEEQFDSNLGMMSDNLARLKNMGLGMTDEIEAQTEQIGRITGEVDRADSNVYGQTKQIYKIL
ncbi:synaptosomal-associated protein 29-like isoform X2 [Lineus longissimus]|uniref:synaptosomal-associated protein 29-like isoform X2 n=1 Tax=Lineus longissimus TaxID=88925 RepID=UPI002B4DB3E6